MRGLQVRLDSYIVDPKLREVALNKLQSSSKACGFGCHIFATGTWDGEQDAYSQIATPEMIVELHESVDDLFDFYRSPLYLHKRGSISYSMMFSPGRLAPKLLMARMNARVNRLRYH